MSVWRGKARIIVLEKNATSLKKTVIDILVKTICIYESKNQH